MYCCTVVGAGVFNDSRVGDFDILEALKSIHDVGLLSAINADDLDVDDLDLGGMYGDFPQRADPHRSAANADADTQLEEENDNFDADFDPAMEASMHLSMSHHPGGGGGGGRFGRSNNVNDRNNLSYSTLFIGYFYAIINVSLDAVTAVVVVHFGQQFNPWEVCAIRYVTGAVCLLTVASGMAGYTCCRGIDLNLKNRSFKNRKQAYVNSSSSSHSMRDVMPFKSLGQYDDGPGVQMSPMGAGAVVDGPVEDVESFERYTTAPNTPIFPGSGSGSKSHANSNPNPMQRQRSQEPSGNGNVDTDCSVISEDILPPRESNFDHVSTDRDRNVDSSTSMHSDLQWFQCPKMPSDNWQMIILGTTFVTFCCPLLYNYSLFQLNVGLCLTLTSMGPIYTIPLVYYLKGESTTLRALIGALITICGVVILCYGQFESHMHSNDANVVSPK